MSSPIPTIYCENIEVPLKTGPDIRDITKELATIVQKSKIEKGTLHATVIGSTGSITTIEYEPGLMRDFPELMEKLIPEKEYYYHNETWHDGNGHSHLRATLVGPSLTVPFADGTLLLGTWQQIIFLEFDNKPHHRKLVVQMAS